MASGVRIDSDARSFSFPRLVFRCRWNSGYFHSAAADIRFSAPGNVLFRPQQPTPRIMAHESSALWRRIARMAKRAQHQLGLEDLRSCFRRRFIRNRHCFRQYRSMGEVIAGGIGNSPDRLHRIETDARAKAREDLREPASERTFWALQSSACLRHIF